MKNERKLVQFYFATEPETSTHYHQNLEILYILQGEMDIQVNDTHYVLRDGDFILINANKRHSIHVEKKQLGARFYIDFHLLAEYMGTMQMLFWCNTVADRNDEYDQMRRLMDRILEQYFEKENQNALQLNALYFEMLHVLTSNCMVKADDVRLDMENSQDRIRVRQIQNYIQANYHNQISLNDLAEQLFLSNAYLSKYIKKHLGLTFMEYLNNVRLFHAVDELLYTKKNMTHIALDNGFPTSAAFNKAFRDIYGEAPNMYRKKMQKLPEQQTDTHQEESQQKILEYIKYKVKKQEKNEKNTKICVADAKQIVSRKMTWNRAVNIGQAYTLLQSEVQNQLLEIQRETGIKYVRIWNLLSKENCFDETGRYNFRKLDLVLDFLADHHMKPYIELGNKPEIFIYTPGRTLKQSENSSGLSEYGVFYEVMKEFCIHLVNRYGADEVESWYFEFWNDPKLHMEQEEGEYYLFFEAIYHILKNVLPGIKVGGAGFILGYETHACREIFRIWNKRRIYPDFLSFCSFQYVAFWDGDQRYGKKSLDGHYMENQIEIMRKVMEDTGFQIQEIHVNEWNFTVSNRNVFNDGYGQGAYILKTSINMTGNVDFMAYWHGLDIYSEYYDSEVLNGDSGMISRDGIRKPSFYAFYFLNKLQPNILKKDENCIVTTNGRGKYVIACHNYKKLSADYAFAEEDQISVEQQEQYWEDTKELNLKLRLKQVQNGEYQVKVYYVNKENGNAQELWKKLDYTKRLAKDEVEYLKKRATPAMEMKSIKVENGVLELENLLKAQEIRLLDIRYHY